MKSEEDKNGINLLLRLYGQVIVNCYEMTALQPVRGGCFRILILRRQSNRRALEDSFVTEWAGKQKGLLLRTLWSKCSFPTAVKRLVISAVLVFL